MVTTRNKAVLQARDCDLLHDLSRRGILYFLDNQLDSGLILDRQSNHGATTGAGWASTGDGWANTADGWASTAATGMGLIAIALAALPPYSLIDRREASRRISRALALGNGRVPRIDGIMPHFLDIKTLVPRGSDAYSTVDTAWLIAGGLVAAKLLGSSRLRNRAYALYRGIDWRSWSKDNLIRHGADEKGNRFSATWDRLNAETAFMYLLAIGAPEPLALAPESMRSLKSFVGKAGSHEFASADLGLFTSQYSLEILDPSLMTGSAIDLAETARKAIRANQEVCLSASRRFTTYRKVWGLSAGDGPDGYQDYGPEKIDGTAHVTATIGSLAWAPELVMENIHKALALEGVSGRYGLSNINLDRGFISPDVVGIDIGMALMACDNLLHGSRIKEAFHSLACIRTAIARLNRG